MKADSPTPTILVIDAEENIRRVITHLLVRKVGANVLQSPDGTRGLWTAQSLRPDLIILELLLPGMNGWEVLSQLKARPETAHIPILVLTVACSLADRLRTAAAGCDAFVCKPFLTAELLGTIQDLLAREDPNHVLDLEPVADTP